MGGPWRDPHAAADAVSRALASCNAGERRRAQGKAHFDLSGLGEQKEHLRASVSAPLHASTPAPAAACALALCSRTGCVHSHGLTRHLLPLAPTAQSFSPALRCAPTYVFSGLWGTLSRCATAYKYPRSSPRRPHVHLAWSRDWSWPMECEQKCHAQRHFRRRRRQEVFSACASPPQVASPPDKAVENQNRNLLGAGVTVGRIHFYGDVLPRAGN